MGDKKKTLAAILGPEKEEETSEVGTPALHSIMSEFIDAVHAKDHIAAADAFKAAHAEANANDESDVIK